MARIILTLSVALAVLLPATSRAAEPVAAERVEIVFAEAQFELLSRISLTKVLPPSDTLPEAEEPLQMPLQRPLGCNLALVGSESCGS